MKKLFFLILGVVLILPLKEFAAENPSKKSIAIAKAREKEFSEAALAYVRNNIDISDYINIQNSEEGALYQIVFKSNRGFLKNIYDSSGTLKKSYQKFENVMLPYEIRNQIYKDYPGYDVENISYRAFGKEADVEKEIYKISIVKDGKLKNIKIRRKLT